MNNDLLTKAQQNLTTATDQPKISGDKYAAGIINDLFKLLLSNYPAWKQAFSAPNDPVKLRDAVNYLKREWVETFIQSGINTPEQIETGKRKVRQDTGDFLISASTFVEMCKPDPTDYGLPDAESAYREACDNCHQPSRHKWSHNIVYAAGCIVQWFNLRTQSGKEDVKNTKRSYLRAYELACKDVMEGKTINGPQVVERGLEQHSQGESVNTEKCKKAQKSAMEEMRKGL